MIILGILSLAIAPGLFWLWFFYSRDRMQARPRKLVARIFVIGMIFSLPVLILESPFLCCGFLLAIYAAPLIEEFAKFVAVHQGVAYRREFKEPMDGIIYAAAAGLGFATVENVFYISQAYLMEQMASTAIIRAVLTVPGHALWSIMWGYPLGVAQFEDRETGTNRIIMGLLLAMICHGLFNFLATFSPFMGVDLFILVLVYWFIALRYVKKAKEFKNPLAGE